MLRGGRKIVWGRLFTPRRLTAIRPPELELAIEYQEDLRLGAID